MATHTVYFRSSLKVSTQTHMYTVHHIPNIFLNQDGKIDLLTFFYLLQPHSADSLIYEGDQCFLQCYSVISVSLNLIVRGLNTKSSMTILGNCKQTKLDVESLCFTKITKTMQNNLEGDLLEKGILLAAFHRILCSVHI